MFQNFSSSRGKSIFGTDFENRPVSPSDASILNCGAWTSGFGRWVSQFGQHGFRHHFPRHGFPFLPFGAFVGALVKVVKWAEIQIVTGAKLRFHFKNQIAITKSCETCDFLIWTLKISRKPEYFSFKIFSTALYGQYFENFF